MNSIEVFAKNKKVGTLAINNKHEVLFQYDKEWIKNGFSLNPLKLPLCDKVFISNTTHFRGLFGVFADSLPDSFGELVLDRYLESKGINSNNLNCLERLTYIGGNGMGMLEYNKTSNNEFKISDIDFDLLQRECDRLLNSKPINNINNLFSFAGSSGGARPKSLVFYKGKHRIVKFSSKFDSKDNASIEYKYMNLAKKAKINIPEIELITTKSCNKYYMIERFDRKDNEKIHMISVAALLECDFRSPCLDYNDLIKLTRIVTNCEEDMLQMYRRMVFNVLIDNQDDHAKNFAFIYDEAEGNYHLSPAFDITPGKTYFLEHTTSINGKGKDITEEDMIAVAVKNKISPKTAKEIIDEIKNVLK